MTHSVRPRSGLACPGIAMSFLLGLLMMGCTNEPTPAPYVPPAFVPTAATEAFCGPDYLAVEERIETLLRDLSLEEKAGLMHGRSGVPSLVEGGDASSWIVDGIPAHGIPSLRMLDGPRGLSRFSRHEGTAFPVAMARGASWDPALEERVGEAMGIETRAAGSNVILAPTINILRHPGWGRAQETYSEDPVHMGEMAVSFIVGAQRHVLASAKHFAANSIEESRFEVDIAVDERTLREVYLPHFRRAVQDAQVASVMSAYNMVNGRWSAESAHLLRDILKGEWAFQGFVESDFLWGTHDTVPSLEGGLDIEMPIGNVYGEPLARAVQRGEASLEAVDAAVRRILRSAFCFGLDTYSPAVDASQLVTAPHVALALEAAQRSIVLLKNEGGLLPLDTAGLTEIVVLGRLADAENIGDTGSSLVIPPYIVTALEGISDRAAGTTVTHLPDETLDASQQATVAGADAVIIVTGLDKQDEGEWIFEGDPGDRETLDLSAGQKSLIAQAASLNAATVVVLEGGAAITMAPWLSSVQAVLMAWYPGMEGGNAIADILFGNAAPSGRLPITFPVAEADLPPFDNVSLEVTYDYYHGYRHLEREGTQALFPFGFGLSYTTFDYANLQLEASTLPSDGTLTLTVDVTNTGTVASIETVQAYVTAMGSRVDRPEQDLRAFTQIALSPGETQTVTLSVDCEDLAFFDVESSSWEVERLTYTVHVGSSSQDLPVDAQFTIVDGD